MKYTCIQLCWKILTTKNTLLITMSLLHLKTVDVKKIIKKTEKTTNVKLICKKKTDKNLLSVNATSLLC